MIGPHARFRLGLLMLLSLCLLPTAHAQQTNPVPPLQVPVRALGNNTPPGSDPLLRSMNEKMALERNAQRQKTIVSQSDELLALARKLKADVAKSNKDELSVSVVREAAEIEKLAKSIKNKMRDGY